WHRGQDVAKRESVQEPVDLGGHFRALAFEVSDRRRESGDDGFDGVGAGDDDGLLAERVEYLVDGFVDAAVVGFTCPGPYPRRACRCESARPAVAGQQVQGELVGYPRAREHPLEGGVDLT